MPELGLSCRRTPGYKFSSMNIFYCFHAFQYRLVVRGANQWSDYEEILFTTFRNRFKTVLRWRSLWLRSNKNQTIEKSSGTHNPTHSQWSHYEISIDIDRGSAPSTQIQFSRCIFIDNNCIRWQSVCVSLHFYSLRGAHNSIKQPLIYTEFDLTQFPMIVNLVIIYYSIFNVLDCTLPSTFPSHPHPYPFHELYHVAASSFVASSFFNSHELQSPRNDGIESIL